MFFLVVFIVVFSCLRYVLQSFDSRAILFVRGDVPEYRGNRLIISPRTTLAWKCCGYRNLAVLWHMQSGTAPSTPNLPTKIIPTKIARLQSSGKFPMGLGIPPLELKIMLESNSEIHNLSTEIGRSRARDMRMSRAPLMPKAPAQLGESARERVQQGGADTTWGRRGKGRK